MLHRKLIGVPLVTCLEKDAKKGSDIRASVATVLKPLLREKSSPTTSKDNGYGLTVDPYISTDNADNAPCSSGRMEVDEESDEISLLQISPTDDRLIRRTPINNDDDFLPESCLRVALEWSNGDFNLYDFTFLEDLPEIFKSVFMSKKTRQETFSLFSCLETFMKEEPLGPDDMWFVIFSSNVLTDFLFGRFTYM